MATLFSATINERLYMNADKKEFDARMDLAKHKKETVEDKKRESLDEMDLDQLLILEGLVGARDTDTMPSAARAIKDAIEEAEADE